VDGLPLPSHISHKYQTIPLGDKGVNSLPKAVVQPLPSHISHKYQTIPLGVKGVNSLPKAVMQQYLTGSRTHNFSINQSMILMV